MDIASVASLVVGAAGFIGGLLAWRKFPGDRESLAVKTQKDVLADMRDLVDELIEALERCRTDRDELEKALVAAEKLAKHLLSLGGER